MNSTLTAFECIRCGSPNLDSENGFYVCRNCKTKYLVSRADENNPNLYRAIEKTEVNFGQIGQKASHIEVSTITPKNIVINDNAAAEVSNSIANVSVSEMLINIRSHIKGKRWNEAQEMLGRILSDETCHNPEAYWYSLLCTKRISSDADFKIRFKNFNERDAQNLNMLLESSSPEYAREKMDIMLENAYGEDDSCLRILSTVIPYTYDESVYSRAQQSKALNSVFSNVIGACFPKAFDYMLNTLNPDEVDKYIQYLTSFADNPNCKPIYAKHCYEKILKVDDGNNDVRRKLIVLLLQSDTDTDTVFAEFEKLVNYSQDVDREVLFIVNYLNSEHVTTNNKSELFRRVLGYYSRPLIELEAEILKYAELLLKSELFDNSREYSYLILNNNVKCADAFLFICLAKLKAKNLNDTMNSQGYLVDCAEFEKFTALLDDSKRDFYQQFGRKQKGVKTAKGNAKKVGLILAAALVLISLIVFVVTTISNSVKYSPNNISLVVTDKDTIKICFSVKNDSSVDVEEVSGVLRAYEGGEDMIFEDNISLKGNFPADKKSSIDYAITEEDVGIDFISYNYDEVSFTFQIESINYSGNISKEVKGKETIVKEFSEEDLSACIAKADELLDTFISDFSSINENSYDFDVNMTNCLAPVEDYWGVICRTQELQNKIVAAAEQFASQEKYYKAYYLYTILEFFGANESENKVLADQYYDWFINGKPSDSTTGSVSSDASFERASATVDTFLEAFDKIDFSDTNGLDSALQQTIQILVPEWSYISSSNDLLKRIYNRADEYYSNNDYLQAYSLFLFLSENCNYSDSATRAEELSTTLFGSANAGNPTPTPITTTTTTSTTTETTSSPSDTSPEESIPSGTTPYNDSIFTDVNVDERYTEAVTAIEDFDPSTSAFSASYWIQNKLDALFNGLSWNDFVSHGYAQALYDLADEYYNDGNTEYALGIFNFLAEPAHNYSDSSTRALECQ